MPNPTQEQLDAVCTVLRDSTLTKKLIIDKGRASGFVRMGKKALYDLETGKEFGTGSVQIMFEKVAGNAYQFTSVSLYQEYKVGGSGPTGEKDPTISLSNAEIQKIAEEYLHPEKAEREQKKTEKDPAEIRNALGLNEGTRETTKNVGKFYWKFDSADHHKKALDALRKISIYVCEQDGKVYDSRKGFVGCKSFFRSDEDKTRIEITDPRVIKLMAATQLLQQSKMVSPLSPKPPQDNAKVQAAKTNKSLFEKLKDYLPSSIRPGK